MLLVLFLILLSYSWIQIITVRSWIQCIMILCLILTSHYCFQDLSWDVMRVKHLPQGLCLLARLKSKRARKESCLVIVSVQVSPYWDAETGVQVQISFFRKCKWYQWVNGKTIQAKGRLWWAPNTPTIRGV